MLHVIRRFGVATTIVFPLYEPDGIDLSTGAVHATGDTKIMRNEGAEVNTGSGFVDEGQGYSLALTNAELQAARIVIYVVDQTATKVWLDTVISIETYGSAPSQHAFDLDLGQHNVNVVSIVGGTAAAANLGNDYDGTGFDKSNSAIGTISTGFGLNPKAEIQQECADAIVAARLDELMSAPVTPQPVTGSMFGDLTENDPGNPGTQRFTKDALQTGPGSCKGLT